MSQRGGSIARLLAWALLALILPFAGAAIAFPLWHLAVNHRLVYTIIVALGLTLIVVAARRRGA